MPKPVFTSLPISLSLSHSLRSEWEWAVEREGESEVVRYNKKQARERQREMGKMRATICGEGKWERQCDRSDRDRERLNMGERWEIGGLGGEWEPRRCCQYLLFCFLWVEKRRGLHCYATPHGSQRAGWRGREWMWNFNHLSLFVILVAPQSKSEALPALSRAILWQAAVVKYSN